MSDLAKPKNGPTFPAPTGGDDDDLLADQCHKLEAAGSPRRVHIDLANTPSVTGVVVLSTWTCPTHQLVVLQGEPCTKCGKKLLLG